MQLKDLDVSRMYLKLKVVISCQMHNNKHHHSNNNNNREQLTISRRPDEGASNKQSRVPAKHELQQYAVSAKYKDYHPRPQDTNRISSGSDNLPSQTFPNLRGNASAITLRSGRELPQITLQQEPRPTDTDSEPNADS
ncbi:hypothetical protein CR513_41645, partial [Mucuna pruriens]